MHVFEIPVYGRKVYLLKSFITRVVLMALEMREMNDLSRSGTLQPMATG